MVFLGVGQKMGSRVMCTKYSVQVYLAHSKCLITISNFFFLSCLVLGDLWMMKLDTVLFACSLFKLGLTLQSPHSSSHPNLWLSHQNFYGGLKIKLKPLNLEVNIKQGTIELFLPAQMCFFFPERMVRTVDEILLAQHRRIKGQSGPFLGSVENSCG